MNDYRIPRHIHCRIVGPLGAYSRAAYEMAKGIVSGEEDAEALHQYDLPMRLLERRDNPMRDIVAKDREFLEPIWRDASQLHSRLVEDLLSKLRSDPSALQRITTAGWFRAGRTSGRHAEQYSGLLDQGAHIYEAHGFGGESSRAWVNQELLPTWLDAVSFGSEPASVMMRAARQRQDQIRGWQSAVSDDALGRLADSYLDINHAWHRTLNAVAASHPTQSLALYERDNGQFYGEPGPSEIHLAVWGGAELRLKNIDWLLSPIPGSYAARLREGDHLRGLILSEDGRAYDSSTCGALLESLLKSIGEPDLRRHIREVPAGLRQRDGSHGRDWDTDGPRYPHAHFGSPGSIHGVTLAHVAPLLQRP